MICESNSTAVVDFNENESRVQNNKDLTESINTSSA